MRVRRGGRIAVVVLAGLVLFVSWLPVERSSVSDAERAVFRWINELPDVPFVVPWLAMQVGNALATVVAAGLALWRRRRRLAFLLAGVGFTTWVLGKVVKHLVGRGRPGDLLDGVVDRDASTGGLGWVSGHAAVTAALVTVAWPALPRRWRWVIVAAVSPMYVARVYVAEHLPLDMVGGAAFGVLCGQLALLASERSSELVEPLGHDAPVHPSSELFAGDEPGFGQDLGVVADGRLALPDRFDQVAGAAGAGRSDHREQPEAHGVGQGGEGGGQLGRLFVGDRLGEDRAAIGGGGSVHGISSG